MINYTVTKTHFFKDHEQFKTFIASQVRDKVLSADVSTGLEFKEYAIEKHNELWTSYSTHSIVEVSNLGEVRK